MGTRRIAITGTDGTGKTTLVRRLAERYAERPRDLLAFRAPQYHENPDHPFGVLSAAIDALSELGDREGQVLLKATALFLSMTLYGDVERHLASAYAPRLLVGERQCVADSLVYARFYVPMLSGPLDQAALEGKVKETLAAVHPDAWRRLQAWIPVFQARAAHGASSFWEIPVYARAIFSLPPEQLVPALMALYHAQLPDQIVVLTLTPEALAARIAEKRGQAGAPPRELHEQAHILAMFQAGLVESCQALRRVAPDLVITTLDSSDRTIADSEQAVLAAIGLES